MGFVALFMVALMPVLKTLLLTAVGLVLAVDRINLLGPTARHNLNNMVFYVFSPCLMGAYLAKTVTFDVMINMWFMPVNILITFVIGSALGWILVKITKAPINLQGLVIGCCAAGNLGNLLLIVIPAICNEPDNPFGEYSVCMGDGAAYVSVSMAVGAIYIWSYVYVIMKISAEKSNRVERLDTHHSVVTIRGATVPCVTLIVGANLLRGLRRSGMSALLIIGIIVVRYIALPLIGIVVVRGAHHFGWVGSNPLYQFVLMLQFALPPAMSIGTISQLFEAGEGECSVVMLWT
ncbi:hypothetical protein SOVF_201870, partial [Spinacia oleracea]